MTEYYDRILGLIPLSLIGLGVGLQVVGMPQEAALIIGGFVAVGMTADALFVNAPVEQRPSKGTPGTQQPPTKIQTAD